MDALENTQKRREEDRKTPPPPDMFKMREKERKEQLLCRRYVGIVVVVDSVAFAAVSFIGIDGCCSGGRTREEKCR